MTDIKRLSGDELPPSYVPAISFSSSTAHPQPASEDTSVLPLPLILPSTSASASEARTYIRSFLYHNAEKYGFQPEETPALAAAWKYGSGQELRSYDRAAWEGLLGQQLGLIITEHVAAKVQKEKDDKENANFRGETIALICLAGIMITVFTVVPLSFPDGEKINGFILASILSFFILIPVVIVMVILIKKVLYNRNNRVETNQDYIRLPGDEDATELQRMDV